MAAALASRLRSSINMSPPRTCGRLAVGDPRSYSATCLCARRQPDHVDGLPLDTRGGWGSVTTFRPTAMRITIQDLGVDLYSRVLDAHTQW
jgi:hypothetical protein